jgi:chloramphenicol 3-O-phosphotransferase
MSSTAAKACAACSTKRRAVRQELCYTFSMTHPISTIAGDLGIILITGNMAAGKSSVAQALAERLPKSVHLRGDLFRRMIVNGRAEMIVSLSAEAERQLLLRYQLAADAAKRYVDAGFTVVYQDIIIGPALEDAIRSFQGYPLSVIVLCPRADVIVAREAARDKTGYSNQADIQAFDRVLRQQTPRIGYWLDTSELTIPETVEVILTNLAASAPAR